MIGGVLAITMSETFAPLRQRTQREPRRILHNLALGVASLAVVGLLEGPVARRLADLVERRRFGLVQRLPLLHRGPDRGLDWGAAWARDLLAVLAMDYTIYVWHVLTHRVPMLWRLHLVHHVDLDLDSSTALRFHVLDMVVSIPWRAAQIVCLGVSRRALGIWQTFFFLSVLFHHSNLRMPPRVERALSWLLTTPRMHGIHHTASLEETDSNWSSGLSVWDRLHGTFRLDQPPVATRIGVPAYHDPAALRLIPSLKMPFRRQRDAWVSTEHLAVKTGVSAGRGGHRRCRADPPGTRPGPET